MTSRTAKTMERYTRSTSSPVVYSTAVACLDVIDAAVGGQDRALGEQRTAEAPRSVAVQAAVLGAVGACARADSDCTSGLRVAGVDVGDAVGHTHPDPIRTRQRALVDLSSVRQFYLVRRRYGPS
jgi:hypothetical protein